MNKTERVLREQIHCMPLKDSVVDYVRNYLVPGKTW